MSAWSSADRTELALSASCDPDLSLKSVSQQDLLTWVSHCTHSSFHFGAGWHPVELKHRQKDLVCQQKAIWTCSKCAEAFSSHMCSWSTRCLLPYCKNGTSLLWPIRSLTSLLTSVLFLGINIPLLRMEVLSWIFWTPEGCIKHADFISNCKTSYCNYSLRVHIRT